MTVLLRVLVYVDPVPGPAVSDPYITVLVRQEDLSSQEWERIVEERNPDPGYHHCCPSAPPSLIITDRRSTIERLLRHPIPVGP